MLEKIFPKTVDNTYKGKKIALYFFFLITLITVTRSLIHMFASDGGAQSIATIPIDSYSTQATQTVILIFSLWGLSQLIMGIFYGVVSIRYRSLVPLMYIFLFIEYLMRLILGMMKPIITTGTAPGGVANYVMIVFSLIMFILSIYTPKSPNNE
ncbi:hypothetical protein K4L44_03890 [Halosquirtibacter laminarini]|uniref:Uncharacterized protein n=1 Tax=Halosquirtibacter laminarini TaxID=3374600 RepID=A0AC61NHG7_9BACT|nr:hypothetical protein K4L44_03890 [Prolixibacteraceae bacterium]